MATCETLIDDTAQRPCAITDGHTILATAEISAPPQRVFRALTTDEAEHWWGSPDTYRVTDWKADVRVGALWSLVVRRPDGSFYPASGKFLQIETPNMIVLTRRYDWDCPMLGRRETTVTYSLDPIAEGTHITVRHDGFVGLKEPAVEHAVGWERFLGWLAAYLNAESKS
jgi:uncharacterized protein YndB with AHSA1/START domain